MIGAILIPPRTPSWVFKQELKGWRNHWFRADRQTELSVRLKLNGVFTGPSLLQCYSLQRAPCDIFIKKMFWYSWYGSWWRRWETQILMKISDFTGQFNFELYSWTRSFYLYHALWALVINKINFSRQEYYIIFIQKQYVVVENQTTRNNMISPDLELEVVIFLLQCINSNHRFEYFKLYTTFGLQVLIIRIGCLLCSIGPSLEVYREMVNDRIFKAAYPISTEKPINIYTCSQLLFTIFAGKHKFSNIWASRIFTNDCSQNSLDLLSNI